MITKNKLRECIGEKLAQQQARDLALESKSLCEILSQNLELKKSKTLAAFYPIELEPDIKPFLLSWLLTSKALALPRYETSLSEYRLAWVRSLENECISGSFQIREPGQACELVKPGSIDLMLVPGIAFSTSGQRLGRGKGHYDKLLKYIKPKQTLGICFSCQITDEIPQEAHDVKLDGVVAIIPRP